MLSSQRATGTSRPRSSARSRTLINSKWRRRKTHSQLSPEARANSRSSPLTRSSSRPTRSGGQWRSSASLSRKPRTSSGSPTSHLTSRSNSRLTINLIYSKQLTSNLARIGNRHAQAGPRRARTLATRRKSRMPSFRMRRARSRRSTSASAASHPSIARSRNQRY